MAIKDLNELDIINNIKINSNFISVDHEKLKIICKIYNGSFYADSYNYFPITNHNNTFKNLYTWGQPTKYSNFYKKEFFNKFNISKKKFKVFKNSIVIGSSAINNYYTNLITFLPRIFFIPNEEINLVIHRNSSNHYREFLKHIIQLSNKKINKFIYLDDDFYFFENSKIPQFFSKKFAVKILNQIALNNTNKKKIKIYVTRQNTAYRNIINESDIREELTKKGYLIINTNNLSINEQVNIFSNADIVIGPTGSALSNIVFCKKNTHVLEIIPKYDSKNEKILKSRYSDICEFLNLKYSFLEADPVEPETIDNNLKKFINPLFLKKSNYYKNLLVKRKKFIEKIKEF